MRMKVEVVDRSEPGFGSWVVIEQTKEYSRTAEFRGKDAQRRAYEYAAGVLGKKGPTRDDFAATPQHSGVVIGNFKPDPSLAAYAKAMCEKYPIAPPSPWISVKERMPEIETAALGNEAGMIGAASLL